MENVITKKITDIYVIGGSFGARLSEWLAICVLAEMHSDFQIPDKLFVSYTMATVTVHTTKYQQVSRFKALKS